MFFRKKSVTLFQKLVKTPVWQTLCCLIPILNQLLESQRAPFFIRLSAVNWVNENYFQFELYGFSSMQYTEYGPDGDFYNWHKDLMFKPNNGDRASTTHSRKLSASVILSNRDEYLGGELYIERDSNNYPVNRILQNIGSIVFFPSFIDHMVAPVTEGTRKSLVVWVEGPKLK
jgi:PKHD-type hydroxylase